jgi:hypothetical protein
MSRVRSGITAVVDAVFEKNSDAVVEKNSSVLRGPAGVINPEKIRFRAENKYFRPFSGQKISF